VRERALDVERREQRNVRILEGAEVIALAAVARSQAAEARFGEQPQGRPVLPRAHARHPCHGLGARTLDEVEQRERAKGLLDLFARDGELTHVLRDFVEGVLPVEAADEGVERHAEPHRPTEDRIAEIAFAAVGAELDLQVGAQPVSSAHGPAVYVFLTRRRLHTTISYISHPEPPMSPPPVERRALNRVPLEIFLNEYVADRLLRGVTTNVSPTGLFIERVLGRRPRALALRRHSRFVQLEFALPGTGETIWARGEVRHDELELPLGDGAVVHGVGVRLVQLARGHARLIRDFVSERARTSTSPSAQESLGRSSASTRGTLEWKRQRLQEILALVRRNRYH
jgi:hypothetical protein